MKDAINNAGLPSDRLEAVWETHDKVEKSQPTGVTPHFLVQSQENLPVVNLNIDHSAQILAITMPVIRDESLALWQSEMGRAFKHAFSLNYEVFHFIEDANQPHYLLRKRL